jgi:hypothetical protein
MNSSFKLIADSDAHAACHQLEKVILEKFPGSVLHQTAHDIRCTVCRYDGTIAYDDYPYAFSFSQGLGHEIDVEIEAPEIWPESLLSAILDAYSAQLDAGKQRHALQLN